MRRRAEGSDRCTNPPGANIASVVLTGQQFGIRADSCTGQILPPGGACVVSVRFRPISGGPQFSTLTVRSSAGIRAVELQGLAVVGTTDISLDSELGAVGSGNSYDFTPRNARLSIRGNNLWVG